MNKKSYRDTGWGDFELNNSIGEKIQQLKDDLDSVDSRLKMADFYSSPLVERVVPGRKLPTDLATPRAKRKILQELEEQSHLEYAWASPSEFMKKRPNDDAISSSQKGSDDFPCGMVAGPMSPISLDYGLVSPPKKVMASPPQRIGRAQNREWSSPHRIIDRPNPESSPGDWVPVRVSHHMVRRPNSPDADLGGVRSAFNLHDYPEPWIRPASQATFTIPDKVPSPQPLLREEIKTVRKSTVLAEFEPVPPEKYEVPSGDVQEYNELPSKVKRYSDKDGHVVKVSKLNDFDFGTKSQVSTMNELGKVGASMSKGPEKIVRGSPPKKKVVKKTVITCDIDKKISRKPEKSPTKDVNTKKSTENEKIESKNLPEEQKQTDGDEVRAPSESAAKEEENKENDIEKMSLETNQMMKDLENLLKVDKNQGEKVNLTARSTASAVSKKTKSKPTVSKHVPLKKEEEEVKTLPIKERKRPANPKAVQDYIKQQKQKRIGLMKSEKEKKLAEAEAKRKKLEELRLKSLQLANASKKKKSDNPTNSIKIIENDEERSLSMSLGLKQAKPKLSYNESILNLKKKTKESPKSEIVETPKPEIKETAKSEVLESAESDIKEVDPEPEIAFSEPNTKPIENALKAPSINLKEDLNLTLKKLAETLKFKMDQREEKMKSRATSIASKSVKDALSQKPSQESLKSIRSLKPVVEENKDLVAVDVETIQNLKEEFKQISKNFQTLHEIILNNTSSVPEKLLRLEPSPSVLEPSEKKPGDLFKSSIPYPHPYNVMTAVKNKLQLNERSASTPCGKPEKISITSRESSIYAEPVKYSSDFELSSDKDAKQGDSTTEENYYSMKDNSGSDFSSSILDSDKQSAFNKKPIKLKSPEQIKSDNSIKESIRSSTDMTGSSVSKRSKLSSYKENLVLVPPDLKLISNDKLNISNKSNDIGYKPVLIEDLNNMVKMNNKDSKSESTIAEIIDNLTESDRSVRITKRTNEQLRNNPQSFFNPEAFHLQFQAELTLLETFQQSLSHFLEMERMKTITEVNRVVNEKAINTEKIISKDDIAVQTSFIYEKEKEGTSVKSVETEESIKTEMETESESIKTEIATEPDSTSVADETDSKNSKTRKKEGKIDSSDSNNGRIYFQMLDRITKDEELRSEHQLALIRLREKTLNEKVKAELTFLEMKKKALKEIGSDVSAIKKKQRGILLKYQSEKEEIERLKKMHKIASEERTIMIKQQREIQKMQVSTKDMLIKLKRKEKSPKKRMPVKAKVLKTHSDSQSEIPEEIPDNVSESILTETMSSVDESVQQSIESDFDLSARHASDEEDEILRRNTKTIEEKITREADKLHKCKKVLGEHEKKLLQRRHSVEELLKWKKRLEEEETRLKELERQAMNVAKHRKSFREVKISMRDTSTSPFQFQEISGKSESSITEAIESKKSSSVSEQIESKTENVEQSNEKTEESVPEKLQSSASEDIPEEFSKRSLNHSNSRTVEYNSESFESPSSSETPKSHPALTRSKSFEHKSGSKGVTIKQALSPRIQGSRRRYSSGSDESLNFSYTETASEQSDVESRIAALHEQLRRRKLEAERLRREQKKAHRERLKAKEQSLIKQIQAYDTYIQKKKQELEQEYEYSSQTIVKPLIKQPKVAEKAGIKRDSIVSNDDVRLSLTSNLSLKKKETVPADKESDHEISESIKEASETTNSISEQIESAKKEEDEEEEETEVAIETESKEVSVSVAETAKSSSISESIPKQDGTSDHSQSESEEYSVSNVSVKTTVHSPEKPDEKSDTIPKSVESATVEEEEIPQLEISEKQISAEEKDAYSTDSFESDFESEKSKSVSKEEEKKSGRSEVSIPESNKTDVISEILSERDITEELTEKEEPKSESVKETGSKKIKDEVVDRITSSILNDLLMESIKLYEGIKIEEKSTRTIDKLTESLASEIITEAINDMCHIYGKKVKKVPEEPISPERITSEVRRRIHEIMSQTPPGEVRERGKPQDMMKTTYDVSPVSTTPAEEAIGTEHEEFLSSLSMVINKTEEPVRRKSEKEIHVDISGNEGTNHHQSDVDAYGQEWFDDDFGLSRTRKEAEELRLQQLQIEQEIQQLQAQQHQEQVPYYYLREIPNKPPPPYTPPGKAPSEKPSTEADITAVMTRAVKILTDEMNSGKEISTVEAPSDFFGAEDSKSVKCYKVFLFDLAKHIISEVLDVEKDEEKLPWMKTNERLSKFKCKRIERTFESLNDYVIKKVLVLFGFRQKVGKESLIVRWSRKKRDHVDELLVSESQEEESQWTRYDKDQVTVKNEVTTAILDTLIDDTVQVLVSIFNKKNIAV